MEAARLEALCAETAAKLEALAAREVEVQGAAQRLLHQVGGTAGGQYGWGGHTGGARGGTASRRASEQGRARWAGWVLG